MFRRENLDQGVYRNCREGTSIDKRMTRDMSLKSRRSSRGWEELVPFPGSDMKDMDGHHCRSGGEPAILRLGRDLLVDQNELINAKGKRRTPSV
ncbi:hypothetical protein B0H10DRAFT_1980046 [Mycena sp. CBHHK59/15]|nr:hypothetical protein B0H10DRAFT_1980046 [Mycena sp. CBHHK59/15]